MKHSTIIIGKDTVTKYATPDKMRIEVDKTRRAFIIGNECKMFRVPEVLEYDEANGIAVFERIRNIQPIRNIVYKSNKYKQLIERIGYSLAIIHKTLMLSQEMTIPLPTEFILPGTEVYIHGDFNGCNICVDMRLSSIVILDWQMTSRHGGQATYGTRYFDLTWFVNYLLWTPTFKYLFSDPVAPVAKIFLESYFREAGILYNAKIFTEYVKGFFNVKNPFRRQHATWRTHYLLPRSQALTQKFIESLITITPSK